MTTNKNDLFCCHFFQGAKASKTLATVDGVFADYNRAKKSNVNAASNWRI
jgi:hypothetical protein